ncbi:hypothetical protein Bpfe_009429, partial [Biomphalaria pfeifferi]
PCDNQYDICTCQYDETDSFGCPLKTELSSPGRNCSRARRQTPEKLHRYY